MQSILIIDKPIGKTPLQIIVEFQKKHPRYREVKIGYAGRLDPMAEGILLLLVGKENLKRKLYEEVAKTYHFDILLGITTDTYDLLGNILTIGYPTAEEGRRLINLLPTRIGKYEQLFPPYSSKPVLGKPLYWWAKRNRLSEIRLPHKMVEIFSLNLIHEKLLPLTIVTKPLFSVLPSIQGDFRQNEIGAAWRGVMKKYKKPFPIFTLQITCSSGTYIRSLCQEMGEKLGCGALASRIVRTQVGDYTLRDAYKL